MKGVAGSYAVQAEMVLVMWGMVYIYIKKKVSSGTPNKKMFIERSMSKEGNVNELLLYWLIH